jgi:hypothetical protein
VPVWHEGAAGWVKDGKLVILGITQEQHAERCQLLAQWHGFDWPILHDPINILEPLAVPVFVAIDEHGIVRSTKPVLASFKADFLDQSYSDDAQRAAPARVTPLLKKDTSTPDWDILRQNTSKTDTAAAWIALGDALVLWGGDKTVDEALSCYARAVKLDPKHGSAWFRLGVCHRRRYDSAEQKPGDFQAAIDHWGKALDLDPNRYIWRRRIQQYGPRLDQPYSFYDWVTQAEKAIRARGAEPVALTVRPAGAEIAYPIKALPGAAAARAPDPDNKIHRDVDGLVLAEITVVPGQVPPGKSARIHLVLRPNPKLKAHWNNEAEPVRLWVEAPKGWQVSDRLLTATAPKKAVTDEPRTLTFEVVAPPDASGKQRLPLYALYNVCNDTDAQCQFLRLDITVDVAIQRPNP